MILSIFSRSENRLNSQMSAFGWRIYCRRCIHYRLEFVLLLFLLGLCTTEVYSLIHSDWISSREFSLLQIFVFIQAFRFIGMMEVVKRFSVDYLNLLIFYPRHYLPVFIDYQIILVNVRFDYLLNYVKHISSVKMIQSQKCLVLLKSKVFVKNSTKIRFNVEKKSSNN